MSNLTQAKREAKRLFNVAKNNDHSLNIKSLNEAQKIIAVINGYKDWFSFEIALNNKDAQIPKNTKPAIHNYLTNEDKYLFKKYYTDQQNITWKTFEPFQYSKNNKIPTYPQRHVVGNDMDSPKKLFQNKDPIEILHRHHFFWGEKQTIATTFALEVFKSYADTNSCVMINYDSLPRYMAFIQRLLPERLTKVLLLNFQSNGNYSHTIDPINPFIPFKHEFLTAFGLPDNQPIREIFYELCLYYQGHALTSRELQAFLSLTWLNQFSGNTKIEELITSYLLQLNLTKDDISDHYFFENKNNEIQQHHLKVSFTQNILDKISAFEEKKLFSPEAQIDFKDIFNESKVLWINYPKYDIHDSGTNAVVNIINSLYLNLLNQENENFKTHLPHNYKEYRAYTCFTLVQEAHYFFNDNTYRLLSSITPEILSPLYFTMNDFSQLPAKYDGIYKNVNNHVFFRMNAVEVSPCFAAEVIKYCQHIPDNFFCPYTSPLKILNDVLYQQEIYYLKNSYKEDQKTKTLPTEFKFKQKKLYHIHLKRLENIVLNKHIDFIQYPPIRKLQRKTLVETVTFGAWTENS